MKSVEDMLEDVGSEVTWEFVKKVGIYARWYVWAAHNGGGMTPSFKFTGSDESLQVAVDDVVRQLKADGPDWIHLPEEYSQ